MLRLAGQARALGHGEPLTALASPVREVNEVSRTLVAAAAERKRSEDQIRFLMRELSHRAKNQLAVVVAMARRTAEKSEGMADFEKVFSERLMALARSTDLLVNQDWRGVALAELIDAHLMPFAAGNKSRLVVGGPAYRARPGCGAVDRPRLPRTCDQRLQVRRAVGSRGRSSRSSGATPTASGAGFASSGRRAAGRRSASRPDGFGSVVIQRTVAQSLNGEVTHEFRPEGVFWAIELPIEAIGRESGDSDDVYGRDRACARAAAVARQGWLLLP